MPAHRTAARPGTDPILLLRSGLVVLPARRRGNGWDCEVLQVPAATVYAADVEIVTAPSATATHHPGIVLTCWMTQVWDRWPGGNLPLLAQGLADAATQDTLVVQLTGYLKARLQRQVRLLPQALEANMKRLVAAGLLLPTCELYSFRDPASFALVPELECHRGRARE